MQSDQPPTTSTYAIVRARLAGGRQIADGDVVDLCDEIDRLRTALGIYANPKHWTFRDDGAWDTTFIGPPGPDREGWEIAAEALR